MASKLNQTYAHYSRELRRVQTEMSEINAKLAALVEAGAAMPDDGQTVLSLQPTSSAAEPDAGPNLTERAFEYVNSRPDGSAVRRVDVGRALRNQGFTPKGKNFPVTLFKTLIRLKNQGRIGGQKVDGIWAFFPKK